MWYPKGHALRAKLEFWLLENPGQNKAEAPSLLECMPSIAFYGSRTSLSLKVTKVKRSGETQSEALFFFFGGGALKRKKRVVWSDLSKHRADDVACKALHW